MMEGRQKLLGSSLPRVSTRRLYSVSAQGWKGTSPGFKSAAMLIRYLSPGTCQIPERSGWPLAFLGTGAARSALPLAVRGIPAVGKFSHCAGASDAAIVAAQAIQKILMSDNSLSGRLYFAGAMELLHADQVRAVLFILEADILHEFQSGFELEHSTLFPGRGVGLGIVHRYFVRHRLRTRAPKTLGEMKLIAMGMAVGVEAGLVVHLGHVDHQGVAIPLSNGISEPGGVEIFRVLAAVGGDRAEDVPGFVQNHHAIRSLDNLNRVGSVRLPGHADGQTRVHLAVEQIELLLAPGCQHGLSASGEVGSVRTLPNSGQVALPSPLLRRSFRRSGLAGRGLRREQQNREENFKCDDHFQPSFCGRAQPKSSGARFYPADRRTFC